MLNILTITGPIYLSIALGFAAMHCGMFSKVDGQVLGRFVLNLALPVMLFHTLSQRTFSEVLSPNYLIAYGVGSLCSFAVGFSVWCIWRKKPFTESGMVAMGVSCSTSGYVGYPLLLQCLGLAAGIGLALAVLQSLKRMIKLPMMQAVLHPQPYFVVHE